MKHPRLAITNPSAPPARLADLCDLRLGVQIAPPHLKRHGPSLEGMRLVRGRDLFLEGPVGEELLSDAVAYRGDPNSLRLRQGDILFPMVARRLRARIVDSSLEGCIAHHTIAVLRPRPGAPSTEKLANILCSREFLKAAERVASARLGGALRLTVRDLLEMPIAFPADTDCPSDSVVALMGRFVRDIIRAIARNGEELRYVEWRILEHVLAAALEDLGFDAQLTAPSKDGGKDIVLQCMERGTRRRYIVEIKHWVSGQLVPGSHLKKFMHIIVNERHDSGLFLSTSGFARNAYDSLIRLEHKRMRVAGKDKIIKLCQVYVKRESGVWTSEQLPTEALFEHTDAPCKTGE